MNIKLLMVLFITALLASCATRVSNITDNITLYPQNDKAEKWGTIQYVNQYTSQQKQGGRVEITLPNKEVIRGQITYLEKTQTSIDYDVWDDVYLSAGSGWGHYRHSGIGFSMAFPPRVRRTRSNVVAFELDAFGIKTRMNCSGSYNRKQRNGTLSCELSNGMKYKGHIRQIVIY